MNSFTYKKDNNVAGWAMHKILMQSTVPRESHKILSKSLPTVTFHPVN